MQAYLALGILLITLILFATEFFKPAVTAISASLAMCILGIIKPADVEAGFSNTVTLLRYCGGWQRIGGNWLRGLSGQKIDVRIPLR